MKSILSDGSGKVEEKPFPKLMISNGDNPRSGLIISFHNQDNGIVVYSGDGEFKIGYYGEWTPSYYMDYEGSVTLSND